MESRKVIRNQTEISRRCWSGSRDQGAFGIGSFSRSSPFVSKEHLKIKNNTGPNADGWGGQFMADVSTGATWVVVVMSLMLRFAPRWPFNARPEDHEITSWYLSHRLHDHGADDWEATGQKPCDLQLLGWHEYCLDERKAFTCEAGVWDFWVIFFRKKKTWLFWTLKT